MKIGKTYSKALKTFNRAAGVGGKVALAAAIYSNPAILTGLSAAYVGEKALSYGEGYANKYFQNKHGLTAKVYKNSRDVAHGIVNIRKGNYIGAARNAADFVSDSNILGKKRTKQYNKINSDYIQPTLAAAGNVKSISKRVAPKPVVKQKVL